MVHKDPEIVCIWFQISKVLSESGSGIRAQIPSSQSAHRKGHGQPTGYSSVCQALGHGLPLGLSFHSSERRRELDRRLGRGKRGRVSGPSRGAVFFLLLCPLGATQAL